MGSGPKYCDMYCFVAKVYCPSPRENDYFGKSHNVNPATTKPHGDLKMCKKSFRFRKQYMKYFLETSVNFSTYFNLLILFLMKTVTYLDFLYIFFKYWDILVIVLVSLSFNLSCRIILVTNILTKCFK